MSYVKTCLLGFDVDNCRVIILVYCKNRN
ncbi:MAG: hypothetical protein EAZ87_16905 [Nostocales cyanobacterium]|nr:MAG: hypothetical protein EAZ87_16905 [Nostocales cyanobacterium]